MRSLKGGYVIIDLTSVNLAEDTDYADITNEEVLKQLYTLGEVALHTDKQLKPVYLRSVDENSVESVSICELNRDNGNLQISGYLNGLSIHIVTSYEIDEETNAIIMTSAQYLLTNEKGTRLYQHYLTISTEDDEVIEVSIISWSPVQLELDNFEILNGKDCLAISKDLGGLNNWSVVPYSFAIDENVVKVDDGSTYTSGMITEFIDVVTEL